MRNRGHNLRFSVIANATLFFGVFCALHAYVIQGVTIYGGYKIEKNCEHRVLFCRTLQQLLLLRVEKLYSLLVRINKILTLSCQSHVCM